MTEFETVWAEWLALSASQDEESFDRYAALEIEVLDHRPITLDEARRVLDVIVAQSEMRSDGRDWGALKRVRAVIIAAVTVGDRAETRRAESRRAAA